MDRESDPRDGSEGKHSLPCRKILKTGGSLTFAEQNHDLGFLRRSGATTGSSEADSRYPLKVNISRFSLVAKQRFRKAWTQVRFSQAAQLAGFMPVFSFKIFKNVIN